MIHIKYAWLILIRFVNKFLNRVPTILSYSFLVFSVVSCFMVLIPNCFDKAPIFSYYISEGEFPITYELCGKVMVVDEKNDIINKDVEVFVGGYSTHLTSTEFSLKFTSPLAREFFVVIRYKLNGSVEEYTKSLILKKDQHVIREEFVIHAYDL